MYICYIVTLDSNSRGWGGGPRGGGRGGRDITVLILFAAQYPMAEVADRHCVSRACPV